MGRFLQFIFRHISMSTVALLVLSLFEQAALSIATDRKADDQVCVFDIRTTEIFTTHVPASTQGNLRDLDKKIDLALSLHLSRATKRPFQIFTPSINQTLSFVNYNPLFLDIEVKRNYGGQDPAAPGSRQN